MGDGAHLDSYSTPDSVKHVIGGMVFSSYFKAFSVFVDMGSFICLCLCCVLITRKRICYVLHLSCSLLSCECPCVVSRMLCVAGGRLLFLNGCWPTFYHVVLANCNINKRHSGPDTPSSQWLRRDDRTHIFVFCFPYFPMSAIIFKAHIPPCEAAFCRFMSVSFCLNLTGMLAVIHMNGT